MSKSEIINTICPPWIEESEVDLYCKLTPYEKRSEMDFLDFLYRNYEYRI